MSVLEVASQLREGLKTGRLGPDLLHALASVERRKPGILLEAAKWLWTHPDKPVHEVTEDTQSERVRKTAADRWNVGSDRLDEPEGLSDLVRLLEHARDQGLRLRFAGSARSLSNVSQPAADGTLVATSRYGERLELPQHTLRDGIDTQALYRAEAGRVLADVLLDLSAEGRSLADMGSGDFQALAGALSTATHGSGVSRGAFPRMVRSMDVVTYNAQGDVIIQRVEPADGISDPERFAAWERTQPLRMTLVQDDATFAAWVVSLGCLGALYSVTLETVPAYWLRETRTIEWWSEVKARMADELNTVPYYELLLSTWAEDHDGTPDHKCLVTRRVLVTDPAEQKVTNGRPETAAIAQTRLGHWISEASALAAIMDPIGVGPAEQRTALKGTQVPQARPYTDQSFEILLLRLDINATSSELAVPLGLVEEGQVDPKNAIDAAERILEFSKKNQEIMRGLLGDGDPFEESLDRLERAWRQAPIHLSPIALRFVGSDDGLLSMWNGGPRCAIEMPMPGADSLDRKLVDPPAAPGALFRVYDAYNAGRQDLFTEIESAFVPEGVRPHWGQVNRLDWSAVTSLYPQAATWRDLYATHNHGGVFDGPLTDQLGISSGTGG